MTLDIASLWDNALSKSTLATYSSALSTFLRFLAMSSQVAPWPPGTLPDISEDTLIHFVSHCQTALHLRYDTIKLYLAGIRFYYIRSKNIDMLAHNLQLPYILRGIKKTQDNTGRGLRLPITFSILQDLIAVLHSGLFSPFLDSMYACIFTMAFYGFLRCGEFTVSTASCTFLQMSDITIKPDHSHFTVLLRSSKTDPFGAGVLIPIFNTPPLFPVSLMHTYLKRRHSAKAQPNSPLFLESAPNNMPLSRNKFITHLRSALTQAGYSDANFSGHSFRIGACTSGAAGGVEDHLLQVLGRWKSSCYTRYIRTQLPSISKAQCQMNTC